MSIFTGMLKTLTWIVLLLIYNLANEENIENVRELISEIKSGAKLLNDSESFWIVCVYIGILFVFIVYMIVSCLIWYKTYITVKDNTIFWEKSFIGTKRKSIAIINISNINIEQTMVQRIFGISTVKLDTNSKSTADATDFKIILKKQKAEEFKSAINKIIDDITYGEEKNIDVNMTEEVLNTNTNVEIPGERGKVLFELEADKHDVVSHGLLNLNIISIVMAVALVGFIIGAVVDTLTGDSLFSGTIKSIGTVVIIVLTFVGEIYAIIKEFFRYFNYKIKRVDDKIHMSYGYFQKVDYTIPVDKINAIIIRQSFFARIFHKFRVDIVNVGMGDDDSEKTSFLLLYDTEDNIFDKLATILPEYDVYPSLKYNKQPKGTLGYKLLYTVVTSILGLIVPVIVSIFSVKGGMYTLIGLGVIVALMCISCMVSIFTEGVSVEEKYLKLVSGLLERSYTWISYDKIEILKLHSSRFAKNYGIAKGSVYILAQMIKSAYSVPFMSMDMANQLRQKIIDRIDS